MRLLTAVAVTTCLIGAMVRADAESLRAYQGEQGGDPGVGVGIICDTEAQAEHFVSLRASGTEAKKAVETVNADAHDDAACGIAAIAFLRDRTVDMKPMGDKLVKVVRINVVAGFNGKDWQRVSSGVMQYAVIDAEGEAI
jgi:hypothetical protein